MDDLDHDVKRSLALREESKAEEANEVLRSALGRFTPRIPADYRRRLIEMIDRAAARDDSAREASATVVSETSGLDPFLADQMTWLVLRGVLVAHGLLEASGVARDHARKAALLLVTTPRGARDADAILRAVQASLDLGDADLARALRAPLGDRSELSDLDFYLRLCGEVGMRGSGRTGATQAGAARRFRRSIAGHSVAVVGPAPSGREHGAEIDTFDVVVRINYTGPDCLPPRIEFGSRIDVSYYNYAIGCRIAGGGHTPILTDLRHSVFKDPKHVRGNLQSRAAHRPHPAYFSGHPNMIPVVVFDLLHFDPARLKVFGTSFFLSKQTHHESYVGCPRSGRRIGLLSLASHDMEAQLNFVRNLVRARRVEVDDMAAQVLEMSSADYLRAMESLYRAP